MGMTNPDQLTLPEVLWQLDALRDHCRSMADEAVDMVLRRLEAMQDAGD